MTGRSLFLVAPESPSSLPPESVLLGLPMIRRTVLAAERAGFDSIAVAADDPADSLTRALAGTSARLVPSGAPIPSGAAVLRWNRVLRTGEIKQLATGASPAPAGVAVSSAADRRPAERWLLDGLVKDTEGFMSRHFERRVSLEISRRLSATSITPNQMTVFSTAVGLVGALFFLSPRASMQTAGALLFLLHSILDGCDGEIARLKFQESRWGGLLDFWGDNAVHAAIFACIAIGWSQSIGQ
ncbi:MAG TPA: CDP-alcohol phosphatidyltransferase family protein, partial [Thermoanaerobaculia bacterium]|nr:CDP-alcohol phosphatidyltransferase family protein [Thermoanaerobaculia bacterium]